MVGRSFGLALPRRRRRALILTVCCLHAFSWLTARRANAASLAAITIIQNIVKYRVADRDEWGPAVVGTPVYAGDWTQTGTRSRAEITYKDKSVFRLASSCLLQHLQPENRVLKLMLGKIWVKVFKGTGGMRIVTPSAQAVVTGTEFIMEVTSDQATRVIVLEGTILLFPPQVNLDAPGQSSTAPNTQSSPPAGEQPGPPARREELNETVSLGGSQPPAKEPVQQPIQVNAGQGAIARPEAPLHAAFAVDLNVVRVQESSLLPPVPIPLPPQTDYTRVIAPLTPSAAKAALPLQNPANDPKLLQGSPTTGNVRVRIEITR